MHALWVIPAPAVALEQKIGLPRPPTSCGVLWHGGGARGAPNVKDGIHKRPGGFDAVPAIKKRGVAADAIVQQRGVRATRRLSKALEVTEVHRHVADAHFRSRALGAKADGDSLVRLNVQHQAIRLHFAFAEDNMRSAAK